MFLKAFWDDEAGAVLSVELVLVGSILCIGCVTGLTSYRDGVITELADCGGALASFNQSYNYGGVKAHCAETAASGFEDFVDFCDDGTIGNECNSRCLIVCIEGAGEAPHSSPTSPGGSRSSSPTRPAAAI